MNLLAILIIGLLAQQQPPRTGSIEGVVVRAGSTQAIGRAVVELIGGNKSDSQATITAADGKFEFHGLPPGRYRLAVSRNGYLNSAYGQRGPSGSGSALSLDSGQVIKDVRLTMIASGAISGRVYDNAGEPAANIPVQAFKYSYADGQRTLTVVKGASTDDRGEYRLFWLPPGQYYVGATPGGSGAFNSVIVMASTRTFHADAQTGMILTNDGSGPEKLGEADVPVYYPGSTETQTAALVEVKSGADISGVDLTLMRVKTHKITGSIVDSLTGQLSNIASVTLVPRDAGFMRIRGSGPQSNGMFEIKDVLPGSYYLLTTQRLNVGNGAFRIMGSRTPIDVNGSDVDRVAVILYPAVDIAGNWTMEAGDGPTAQHPVLILNSDVTRPGLNRQTYASFNADGQFVVNDVVEGDYQVRVSQLPEGTYLKSVRFGATDVLSDQLHLDPRSNDRLTLVLGTNAGVLEGNVVSRNGQPLANVPVALVPAAHRERADLYKNATTDDSGHFRLQGIAPGDYAVFAWEDIEDGQWRDPDFIRQNEASGKAIHINEGSREVIDLIAIPFF
jgi:hypothetical protein